MIEEFDENLFIQSDELEMYVAMDMISYKLVIFLLIGADPKKVAKFLEVKINSSVKITESNAYSCEYEKLKNLESKLQAIFELLSSWKHSSVAFGKLCAEQGSPLFAYIDKVIENEMEGRFYTPFLEATKTKFIQTYLRKKDDSLQRNYPSLYKSVEDTLKKSDNVSREVALGVPVEELSKLLIAAIYSYKECIYNLPKNMSAATKADFLKFISKQSMEGKITLPKNLQKEGRYEAIWMIINPGVSGARSSDKKKFKPLSERKPENFS